MSTIRSLNAPEPLEVTALTPVSVPAILQARLLREPATSGATPRKCEMVISSAGMEGSPSCQTNRSCPWRGTAG
eukprot:4840758-Prymnesium_polylepis.2